MDPDHEAARTWLHAEAEVVDASRITPPEAADRIAAAVRAEAPRG